MIGLFVSPKFRATNDGRPKASPISQVVRKLGTIPHFYEVRVVETGALVRCFVYPEDVVMPSYLKRIK